MYVILPSGRAVIPPIDPLTYAEQAPGVIGTAVNAVELERDVSSAVAFHRRRPLFQGLRTAAVSVASSTWTMMPLAEQIDTWGGHSDSANPSRVYAPFLASSADWYLCTGYVPYVASVGTKVHTCGIRHTGGTVYEGVKVPGASGGVNGGHNFDVMVCDLLQVTDTSGYVELGAWHDTGAALNTAASGGGRCPSLTVRWACSGTGDVVTQAGMPRTWTATDLLTADTSGGTNVPLNAHVRDVLRFLRYPPAARLHSIGTAQTIPAGAGTWTSINMVGESLDNYGGHDNAVNNSRYTAQRAGLYYVYGLAAVTEPLAAAGYRQARLLVNGTTAYAGMSSPPATNSTAGTALAAQGLIRLNAGDYVELQLQQTQGASLNVKGGAGDHSRLIALWMSL